MNYASKIAEHLNLGLRQVEKTIELLEGGATVPFIARYRKEATGSLNEVQIAAIRDMLLKYKELNKRRDSILQSIDEQGKLTPQLEQQLKAAETMTELEDLYLPYKPKRKTRATIAIEKGLEPLAIKILQQKPTDLFLLAREYIDAYMDDLRELAAEKNPFDDNAAYLLPCRFKKAAVATGAALGYISDLRI